MGLSFEERALVLCVHLLRKCRPLCGAADGDRVARVTASPACAAGTDGAARAARMRPAFHVAGGRKTASKGSSGLTSLMCVPSRRIFSSLSQPAGMNTALRSAMLARS